MAEYRAGPSESSRAVFECAATVAAEPSCTNFANDQAHAPIAPDDGWPRCPKTLDFYVVRAEMPRQFSELLEIRQRTA